MAELLIYRNSAVFATVHIGKDTLYQGQFMGENKIVANFNHPSVIDFSRGDYIIHKGKEWRLNEVPTETKSARNKYQYNLVFEGREYTWHDKQLMHLGVSDFTFFGKPLELITLLVNCINEIDPGWIIGTVDNTADPQFFSFKDQSVRQALTTVAEGFKMEYQFDNRTLNFRNTIGTVVAGVTLKYGKGNGLYSLTRQPAGDASIATRVYGYGGTQNIPADYRGGLTRLTFAERKIDNNIATYGVIETSVTFDDIIPERLAAITSTANPTTVTDTTLDFDLNSVIVQGQAKIVFITGDLGGNEFLITDYNHATKTIKFEANTEENGYVIPNATVKPKAGDQYKLVGITMPQTYITAAEARLKTETTNYANSIKNPPVSFGLAIDQLQAKAKGLDVSLKLGDKLHTVDTEMGVDETLRVQAFSYPLINPAEITATISDKVTYTRAERIRQIIAKQQESIREIVKGSAELQRISSIRREELQGLVFDPDGFFKTENIRPLSIDTNMISVGSRSQEFSLSVIFKPNFNGDANRIDWTAGVLTHFSIADTVKTWTIATGSRTALADATAYYIYARCSKVGTTGTIVFDTVQRKVDADATYYYFLVGVLSSVIDGIRWPTLTYGTTEINGGFIRTGRIESTDGKAWFDLTTSQFRLGDATGGIDWNVTVANQLTIIGRIVATSGEIGGFDIVGGVLQANLQKVTDIGATTDRIMTAKGLRANELLVIPSIAGAETGAIWHGTGSGSDLPPTDLPIASATVLGGVKIGNGLTINPSTGVLSVDAVDLSNYYTKSQSDARYELAFSKNTGFNKNFGTIAGTVAQGNDSRILNGQTAFGWGDHVGKYMSVDVDGNTVGIYSTTTTVNLDTLRSVIAYNGGNILSMARNSSYGGQFMNRTTGNTWRARTLSAGIWSDWNTFWHDGNLRSDTQNDVRYVLKTGNETISGIKQFGTATTFLPTTNPTTIANGIHINSSTPSLTGGSYIQGKDYQNNVSFTIRNYVLTGTGEQLTLSLGGLNANGDIKGKTITIDSESAGAVSHISFNRANSYITALDKAIHFQTKNTSIGGTNPLLSLYADQSVEVRGLFTLRNGSTATGYANAASTILNFGTGKAMSQFVWGQQYGMYVGSQSALSTIYAFRVAYNASESGTGTNALTVFCDGKVEVSKELVIPTVAGVSNNAIWQA